MSQWRIRQISPINSVNITLHGSGVLRPASDGGVFKVGIPTINPCLHPLIKTIHPAEADTFID